MELLMDVFTRWSVMPKSDRYCQIGYCFQNLFWKIYFGHETFLFLTRRGVISCALRPEFFHFSFYRPSRPNFLKKKKKSFFFSILFLYFPPTHASTQLEFN